MIHKRTTIIMFCLVCVVSLSLFFSCNIDGSGIFVTISKTTEIINGDFATEPVKDVITEIGDYLYIQHRSSLKASIVSDGTPISWANITGLTDSISDIIFDGSDFVYTTIDEATEKYDLKKATIVTNTVTSSSTLGTGYDQIDLIQAQGSTAWFAVTYDTSSENIVVFNASLTSVMTIPSLLPYRSVSAFKNDVDDRYYFSFSVHDYTGTSSDDLDLTDGFDNWVSSTDGSIDADDETLLTTTALSWDFDDDIATITYSGIVSVLYDSVSDVVYVAGDEGQLASFDVSNAANFLNGTNITELYDPSTNAMALTYDSGGNKLMITGIPMIIVQRSGKQILLIGGYSRLYEYNITDASLPATVSPASDPFYNNLSSTRILDFYDYGVGDFDFYAATSDKWVWDITEEGVPSSQIL